MPSKPTYSTGITYLAMVLCKMTRQVVQQEHLHLLCLLTTIAGTETNTLHQTGSFSFESEANQQMEHG